MCTRGWTRSACTGERLPACTADAPRDSWGDAGRSVLHLHTWATRYVEWKLESVARDGPFVMLYVHSNASYTENCPGVLWLRSLYSR